MARQDSEGICAVEPVHLLWTGGWDSTFRLLQASICEESTLQPHYIIDHKRRGSLCELAAMASIKEALADRFAAARARVLPTRLYERCELPQIDAITASHRALLSERWIGFQYEWLARFAEWQRVPRLELAIHRDDRAHAFLRTLVAPDSAGGFALRGTESGPAAILFRRFVYPILDLTKLRMASIAEENGFSDILEMTWFCHSPDEQLRACGHCGPCRYTIAEGLARRVPLRNRVKGKALHLSSRAFTRVKTMLPRGAPRL